jgi:hypothetical protein
MDAKGQFIGYVQSYTPGGGSLIWATVYNPTLNKIFSISASADLSTFDISPAPNISYPLIIYYAASDCSGPGALFGYDSTYLVGDGGGNYDTGGALLPGFVAGCQWTSVFGLNSCLDPCNPDNTYPAGFYTLVPVPTSTFPFTLPFAGPLSITSN